MIIKWIAVSQKEVQKKVIGKYEKEKKVQAYRNLKGMIIAGSKMTSYLKPWTVHIGNFFCRMFGKYSDNS